jgi:hypothetical protein
MAVEAQPGIERKVTAELQEERAEVAIHCVDIVVVHHCGREDDPGIGLTGPRVPALLGAENWRLLLRLAALDNGVLSCADPKRLQQICDGLSAVKGWGKRRNHLRSKASILSAADRKAGYRYDISILQAEFSLTQVLDRPAHGRLFFEQVIRENLDLGRPEEVQLVFNRTVTRRTPGPGSSLRT